MQAWSCRYFTERRDINLSFVHPARTDTSLPSCFHIRNTPERPLSWGTGLHCHGPACWPSCKALVPIQDPLSVFFTCGIRGSATAWCKMPDFWRELIYKCSQTMRQSRENHGGDSVHRESNSGQDGLLEDWGQGREGDVWKEQGWGQVWRDA